MIGSENCIWKGVATSLDGIQNPNVTVINGDCGGSLVCLVSEWSSGECLRVHSVTFERAAAFLAIEESLFSIVHRPDNGAHYDGSVFLKETVESPLAKRLNEVGLMGSALRHFLLVGLNTCLEVVAASEPNIVQHRSYVDALAVRVPA
jgi:hypothetical protein